MESLIIKSGKESMIVPGIRYQLNNDQHILLVGFNGTLTEKQTITFDIPTGFQAISLGRLSEQQLIFQKQTMNSLERDQWDFKVCMNPIIILLFSKNGIPMQNAKNGRRILPNKD